jgi:hypothetical protein
MIRSGDENLTGKTEKLVPRRCGAILMLARETMTAAQRTTDHTDNTDKEDRKP